MVVVVIIALLLAGFDTIIQWLVKLFLGNDSTGPEAQGVKRWYVVRVLRLRSRWRRPSRPHRPCGDAGPFGDVLVPTEEVVEMRSGQKRRSERKFFPSCVWSRSPPMTRQDPRMAASAG